MEITDHVFVLTEKIPTIAMMDVFTDWCSVKIAPGTKTPHGNIVAKYALKDLESKVGLLLLM